MDTLSVAALVQALELRMHLQVELEAPAGTTSSIADGLNDHVSNSAIAPRVAMADESQPATKTDTP